MMDLKPRYPCCFQRLVCVGCRSQAYRENIQEKRGETVCEHEEAAVGGMGGGGGGLKPHARIQRIREAGLCPLVNAWMEER